MKKTNIFKLIVVAALACVTAVATVVLAGCGKTELVGMYKEYNTTNHNTSSGDFNLGYQHEYTLEIYSDKTYKMEYNAFYAISQWQGSAGRTVFQYGTYTTEESAEEGQVVYNLSLPTRIIYMGMTGGYNGALTEVVGYVDTADWSKAYPLNEDGNLEFVVSARTAADLYKSADSVLKTLGRSYKVTCQKDEFHRMVVEVTSNDGKQINGYDVIIAVE